MVDKDFYNEASAAKLGWDPSWLGETNFDDKLVRKIRAFQREYGLKPDGLLGPSTYRRLKAHKEAQEDYDNNVEIQPGEKAILYKGKKYPINWDKVVLPSDPEVCNTQVVTPRANEREMYLCLLLIGTFVLIQRPAIKFLSRGIVIHLQLTTMELSISS